MLKRTGLKYKFVGFSIAAIIISAILGSLVLHFLIKVNQTYSPLYLFCVALFFVIIGVGGVLLTTRLMVQPVISLTRKVYEVQQGNLDVQMNDGCKRTQLDEMDRLFEGFNHMVRNLKQNIAALTSSRQKAETYSRQLFESKKKLEAIFNGISDGIMIIDKEFRVVTANPVIEKIIGRTLPEIQGQHCYEMCNGTLQRCSFCKADIALKNGEHVTSYCTKIIEGLGEKIFEVHDFPMYDKDGEIDQIVEYVKDVTEAVRMQKNLESSRRLAETGEMAAKVAHEVRNPLNAIKGAAHYLRNEVTNGDSESYLNLIEEQVERVNKVATDLLVLSKPLEAVFHPGNLNEVMDRSLLVTQTQLEDKQISVRKEITRRLPQIPLDDAQMEQAFVNLLLNAVDAMHPGGQLRIRIDVCDSQKNSDEKKIEVLIRDDGCGIRSVAQEELFKPFFTTKTKGTGLGLTIVKKIVDNHHGTIEIRSQEEKGTDIILALPVDIRKHETQNHNFGS